MAQKTLTPHTKTNMASKAYRELREMKLNPRDFLPSVSFLASVAEIEQLPEEDFLAKVRKTAYEVMAEPKAPIWSAYVRRHGGGK